jgi:hypothetical protein
MFGKKTATLLIILTSIAITAYASNHLKIPATSAQENLTPWVTMYMEPSNITDLNISETFDMLIKIKNFTDLYSWQCGIEWDPSILEVTNVIFGKALWSESVFAVLAPTRSTNPMPGTIDNVAGQIYPPYAEALTGTGGVTGASPDTGYNIMKVTFRVKSYAPEGTEIRFNVSDPYGPVSCWAQYPNVSTLLTPTFANAMVYTVAPVLPKSPIANFTWTPTNPIIYRNVTFDASNSLPGFDGTNNRPITEYRWDFNGDLTFELNTTEPTATHSFDETGDHDVTLEVYAPGNYPPDVPDTNRTTKTITVIPPPPTPVSPTLVYIDKPTINATTLGETVEVTVKIQDFIQLYVWQVGVKWDPAILNCTDAIAGPDLTTSVFKVLAPGRYTLYVSPIINNTAGKIEPAAESLTTPGEGVTGQAGVSYDLMKLTFKVIGTGVTDLHLYEVATHYYPPVDGFPWEGQTLIIDTYTVRVTEGDFTLQILTNSTGLYSDIYGYEFCGPPSNTITFTILARSYKAQFANTTSGFTNITIPKALMWVNDLSEWNVLVNGQSVQVTVSENSTHYSLYFTYDHRTDGDPEQPYPHEIIIHSTYAIPEYPNILLLMFLLAIMSTALLLKKRLTK